MTEILPMPQAVDLDNAYWDAVRDQVTDYPPLGGPIAGGIEHFLTSPHRQEMVERYAWTISHPDTLDFVAEHCGPRVLDPLAGSGYWAHLLRQRGVDVVASDATPPRAGGNDWHQDGAEHVHVVQLDALIAADAYTPGRVLLLSWPPYGSKIGTQLLASRTWPRVIYMGEYWGNCGDDDLFEALEEKWALVAEHRPVQWFGLHDMVCVYEPKRNAEALMAGVATMAALDGAR